MENSQVVLRLFCQDAQWAALALCVSLSVFCFLPAYLSPPSVTHIHKSKTHQQLSPPTRLVLSLPLLFSLELPPLPSSFLSFAPLQNILNTKATSHAGIPPFLSSHSFSSSPSPLFLYLLSGPSFLALLPLSLSLSLDVCSLSVCFLSADTSRARCALLTQQ